MKELEDKLGAGEDTIRRCMRTMRDLLDLPIHYVPEKNGYGYTQKVTGFPLLIMTEDDLSAMVMGQ